MTRTTLFIALTAMVLSLALTSCHSNEQNYKQAYDKAVAKHIEGVGDEAYNRVQAERRRFNTVINGDSVRLVRMYANVSDDSTKVARRYNIIVGEFKQMFNAQNYRDRLKAEEGFPSYLLYGGLGTDKKYFVVVKGFDDRDVAGAFLKDLSNKMKMQILVPQAWILEKL
ncbi:MAG: SPOR domain-containing protein [Muribaculaceae bacterium]|nr:SPOR domain-containing protein [Muribaculaceae bacterium]